jgi:hypothetical protein
MQIRCVSEWLLFVPFIFLFVHPHSAPHLSLLRAHFALLDHHLCPRLAVFAVLRPHHIAQVEARLVPTEQGVAALV